MSPARDHPPALSANSQVPSPSTSTGEVETSDMLEAKEGLEDTLDASGTSLTPISGGSVNLP